MRKRLLICFLVVLIIISMFSVVSAGPYGYGDSADLQYREVGGKIIYGYGDGVKYQTSLRPEGVNWSEWKKSKKSVLVEEQISKRKVINLTWAEIDEKIKKGESIGKEKKVSVVSNLIMSLVDKVSNFFLGFVVKEDVEVKNCEGGVGGEIYIDEMPNPAAVYCKEKGYVSRINETEAGQQGICIFPDGTECDEWAFIEVNADKNGLIVNKMDMA